MAGNIVSLLNRLAEVCHDGELGFAEAARATHDQHLAVIFIEISAQRNQFAAQLRYEVSRIGGRPTAHGSVSGVLHRRWIDVRSAVSGRSDHAIIAECSRGEEHAKRAYEEALEQPLPERVEHLLRDQYMQIGHTSDRVRNLEVKLNHQPAFER